MTALSWFLDHKLRYHSRLYRLKVSVWAHSCDTCVLCGLTWRATHSLPSVEGTGVLSVLTGTHPCGPPPRQDGRAYGLCVLRARGRVCGRWFCGVSAVDSRTFIQFSPLFNLSALTMQFAGSVP